MQTIIIHFKDNQRTWQEEKNVTSFHPFPFGLSIDEPDGNESVYSWHFVFSYEIKKENIIDAIPSSSMN